MITDKTRRVQIVDFDWPGKHVIDRYVPTINEKLFGHGVECGGLMMKEYDIDMLKYIGGTLYGCVEIRLP
jgi:hypothetical protein